MAIYDQKKYDDLTRKLLKITYLKIEYKLVSVYLHRYNELRLLRLRQRPWYRVDDVPLCLPGDEGD